MESRILAVIPARGGSKGLPGKNIRPFCGLPLIAHGLQCARRCPSLSRVMVSTDSPEIAETARQHGGWVPSLRPTELAGDTVAMWPVLQHALDVAEQEDGVVYDRLVLIDATHPTRLPEDLERVVQALDEDPLAESAITVSEPHFSPYWHMLTRGADGFGRFLMPEAHVIVRRQECPTTYFINGLAYAFTRQLLKESPTWVKSRCKLVETPAIRAVDIDTAEQFEWLERMFQAGLYTLPWLQEHP